MEKPRITSKVETEPADTPITIPVFEASVVVQKTASTLLLHCIALHQSIEEEDVYLENVASAAKAKAVEAAKAKAVGAAPMPALAAR